MIPPQNSEAWLLAINEHRASILANADSPLAKATHPVASTYTIACLPETIPALAELASYNQWVAWQYKESTGKDGQLRKDKIPYTPAANKPASTSNPATWGTYANARARAAMLDYAGVGFVFSQHDLFAGIDLDGCRNPDTGVIEAWAWAIIEAANSYTEISPSKTGVKIYGRGQLERSLSEKFGAHYGIEAYDRARYFCITGQHLTGTPTTIGDIQPELDRLAVALAPAPPAPRQPQPIAVRRVSPGEQASERLSGGEAIAQFNAMHSIESLLVQYGGTETKSGWTCNCGVQHSHSTQLQVLSDNTIVSYSDQCGWAPHYSSKRATDAFGLFCIVEHHGSTIDALKAINPYSTRNATTARPAPNVAQTYRPATVAPEEQPHRNAQNAQRRAKRHEGTLSHLAALEAVVARLDMPHRAYMLAHYLFMLVEQEQSLQVRPTNAHIQELLGMSRRTVQYAFADLQRANIGRRTGGRSGKDSGTHNEAATWTFAATIPRVQTDSSDSQAAHPGASGACTLLNKHDPTYHESIKACERGANPTPAQAVAVPSQIEQPPVATTSARPAPAQPDQQPRPLTSLPASTTIELAPAQPGQPGARTALCADAAPVAADERPCAYYDPALAAQPLPPAQPHERPAWQRTNADMQPMIFIDCNALDAADLLEQPTTPILVSGGSASTWQDAYRAKLQAKEPSALAGERVRQQRCVTKAERESLSWLKDARARLELVYAEMNCRRAAQPAKTATPCKARKEQAISKQQGSFLDQLDVLQRSSGAIGVGQ